MQEMRYLPPHLSVSGVVTQWQRAGANFHVVAMGSGQFKGLCQWTPAGVKAIRLACRMSNNMQRVVSAWPPCGTIYASLQCRHPCCPSGAVAAVDRLSGLRRCAAVAAYRHLHPLLYTPVQAPWFVSALPSCTCCGTPLALSRLVQAQ